MDLLRGLIMVVMGLDHTRDFVSCDPLLFRPTRFTRDRRHGRRVAFRSPETLANLKFPREPVEKFLQNSDDMFFTPSVRPDLEKGCPSEMYVRATKDGERITNGRVGGCAVELGRETMSLGFPPNDSRFPITRKS